MCGYANPDDARVCTRCGSPIVVPTAEQAAQRPQAAPSPAWTTPQPAAPGPSYAEADLVALRRTRVFSLIGIAQIALVVVFVAIILQRILVSLSRSGGNPSFGDMFAAIAWPLALSVVVGLLLGFAGFAVLYSGFRAVASLDVSLKTPTSLLPLLVVGQTITAATSVAILFGSAGTAAAPTVLALAPINLVGALIGLVGQIGGQTLGLWRLGSRYDDSLMQLGALFSVIPLLNLAAPVLLYFGAGRSLRKVGQRVAQGYL